MTKHGVERSSLDGVSVEDVEVGLELFSDDRAQSSLSLGRQILVDVLLHFWPEFVQPSDPFLIGDDRDLFGEQEGLRAVGSGQRHG